MISKNFLSNIVQVIFPVLGFGWTTLDRNVSHRKFSPTGFFVASPRTILPGLQSTVTALPCTYYKTEVLDTLLSAQIFIVALVIIIYHNGAMPQPTSRTAAMRLLRLLPTGLELLLIAG